MKYYMIALWRLGYIKWMTLYTSVWAALVGQGWFMYSREIAAGNSPADALVAAISISVIAAIFEAAALAVLVWIYTEIYSSFIEPLVQEIKEEAESIRRVEDVSEQQAGRISGWPDED